MTTLRVLTWVDVTAYTCLLLFGIRNTAKYLVKQGKWRTFFLSMFYLCTFEIATSRIIDFVCAYLTFSKDDQRNEMADTISEIASELAFYGKAALGVFQIGTMNELSIRLKQAAAKLSKESA